MARNNPDTITFDQAKKLYKSFTRAQKAKIKAGMEERKKAHAKLEMDFPYSERNNCFRELVAEIVSGRDQIEEEQPAEDADHIYHSRRYDQYTPPGPGMMF